jgi:hypothetical protein
MMNIKQNHIKNNFKSIFKSPKNFFITTVKSDIVKKKFDRK